MPDFRTCRDVPLLSQFSRSRGKLALYFESLFLFFSLGFSNQGFFNPTRQTQREDDCCAKP